MLEFGDNFCNVVTDRSLNNILLPSEPTVAADSPDGLANIGLGVRMAPRPFEVRSANRVLKRFASQGMTPHFEEARHAYYLLLTSYYSQLTTYNVTY